MQSPLDSDASNNIPGIKLKRLNKDENSQFNVYSPWTGNDMFCIDIETPPPNTVLVPYYNVYIRWYQSKDCKTINPLTNFMLTLHNNPKSSENRYAPKVKSEWSTSIASSLYEFQYKWVVPLIAHGTVKNMSLFYIRIETEGIVNSGMYTVFGVIGPLTIWTSPGIENKTLFAPKEEFVNSTSTTPPVQPVGSIGSKLDIVHIINENPFIFNIIIIFSLMIATVLLFI
nr:14214_t:CDS:1 [Entrophospora candida]